MLYDDTKTLKTNVNFIFQSQNKLNIINYDLKPTINHLNKILNVIKLRKCLEHMNFRYPDNISTILRLSFLYFKI